MHLRVGIEEIANPGHGQVAQDFVRFDEAVEGHEHPCRLDHRSVRLGYAFGMARGARCIENHRDIGGPAFFELVCEEARIAPRELPAGRLEVIEGGELRLAVMPQPARVDEADALQPRALRQDFQQLVDLLLVFDDGKADFGVLEHEGHFGRHGILVERHGHAAQGLRSHHGPVQARPVVADHREAVAALESQRSEAAGENADLLRDLGPGPGLPDAEVLLAERRPGRPYPGLVQQQARKGVRLFRHGVSSVALRPKTSLAVPTGASYSITLDRFSITLSELYRVQRARCTPMRLRTR